MSDEYPTAESLMRSRFEAFARGAACNLHVVLHAGTNLHHMTEICFKAFAKALRAAASIDPRASGVPSTKGSL